MEEGLHGWTHLAQLITRGPHMIHKKYTKDEINNDDKTLAGRGTGNKNTIFYKFHTDKCYFTNFILNRHFRERKAKGQKTTCKQQKLDVFKQLYFVARVYIVS